VLAALARPVAGAPSPTPKDKLACADAFARAQELAKEAKLLAAREETSVCMKSICPPRVRKECSRVLDEIDRGTPSVVVSVRDGRGRDLVDATLTLDGKPIAELAQGKAVEIDPGRHVARAERPGGARAEEPFMVREGEKLRRVVVAFPSEADSTPGAAGTGSQPRASRRTAAYALGAVGALGLVGFTVFGLRGSSREGDLESGCSPRCSPEQVSSVKMDYLVADVSLAVGLAALAVGGYLWIGAPKAADKQTSGAETPVVRVLAVPSGGALGVQVRF
jgi:hypothetical protein